jgi:hypothetical protein
MEKLRSFGGDINKGRETWNSKLLRLLNSTMCFCIAYMIITYACFFVSGLAAKIFNYQTDVFYHSIKFFLHQKEWKKLSVTVIFSTPVIVMAVLGLLAMYLNLKLRKRTFNFNLILVWMFVVGTTMACMQGLIANLGLGEYNSYFYQNLAIVFSWFFIPEVLGYVFTAISFLVFLFFTTRYIRPFLALAYSYSKVNKLSRRRKYFFETVLAPYILGAFITSYITFPMNMYVHLIYIAAIGVALFLSWVALSYVDIEQDFVYKYKGLQSVDYFLLLFFFSTVVFVYTIGFKGIIL